MVVDLAKFPRSLDVVNRVVVYELPTLETAISLFQRYKMASVFASEALRLLPYGYRGVAIRHPECQRGEFAFYIPATMAGKKNTRICSMEDSSMSNVPTITSTNNGYPNLKDASRRTVLDFIEEQRDTGKVVVVTSQITNRCVDIQNIDKNRGILAFASQWHGTNFMELWRESLNDFFRLIDLLNSESVIPGYEYELLRVDSSKGKYCKDYYLANNFLPKEPVRISVSNKEDWELIRPAIA